MNEMTDPRCPECDVPALDRRNFIRVLGTGAAALAATAVVPRRAIAAPTPAPKAAKPAEALIHELHAGLSAEQKKTLVLPMNHGVEKGTATRLGMYNEALMKQSIGKNYSKAQQDLIHKIVKASVSGEDGYHRISREGTWDASGSFENCGCHLFGEPEPGKKFVWMFTGHHLTLRCDGDSADGTAWGGPVYYGHSPNGHSDKNVFYFQTKSVMEVYRALDEKQKVKAVASGDPGELAPSVRFRKASETRPGIAYADLTKEQQAMVANVMRELLSPYRKEDGDEVMAIIKANGGMDKIHLAYYRDKDATDGERWHFWRVEGPGFVWNYRVLPHVHCYVNIANAKG